MKKKTSQETQEFFSRLEAQALENRRVAKAFHAAPSLQDWAKSQTLNGTTPAEARGAALGGIAAAGLERREAKLQAWKKACTVPE